MSMSLASSFEQEYGRAPQVETRAPGRVNLLGEHVDYNQGVVLPIAIHQAVRLVAAPTPDDLVSLCALDLHEQVSIRLNEVGRRCDQDGRGLPGWALYPAGVAWALQQAGFTLHG